MDIKQIRTLVDLMNRSDLTDFEVEEEGFKLRIRRNAGQPATVQTQVGIPLVAGPVTPTPAVIVPAPPVASPALPAPAMPAAGASAEEAGVVYIKSPMVGTFYRAAAPESPAFVEPGAAVTEKSVVCIIEAMKIMNEIQAELKGTILEVLVESGQPVEYGQRLFKVKQG
ncbi:MAG: acetyl-CoA carboxylase biotin carboxyl carrier protein [Opitutaceae bacterium]